MYSVYIINKRLIIFQYLWLYNATHQNENPITVTIGVGEQSAFNTRWIFQRSEGNEWQLIEYSSRWSVHRPKHWVLSIVLFKLGQCIVLVQYKIFGILFQHSMGHFDFNLTSYSNRTFLNINTAQISFYPSAAGTIITKASVSVISRVVVIRQPSIAAPILSLAVIIIPLGIWQSHNVLLRCRR